MHVTKHFSLHFVSIMHTAGQFSSSVITVSAKSVGGSIPAARVNWSTTIPHECVTSVRVDFRTKPSAQGDVVATYTTTNTSETEFVQTGLRCGTWYYITVVVAGELSGSVQVTASSRPAQALVGGKRNCLHEIQLVYKFDGGYAIRQMHLLQLEWGLQPLQATQVSECHGGGRVCPCVLTMLEFTTDLKEAL